MLPVLRDLADRQPRNRASILQAAADHFALPEADRLELLSSGKMTVLRSRVGWALSYMKQARLLESPKRGVYQITSRGLDVLSRAPAKIDVTLLSQFPEFVEFRARGRSGDRGNAPPASAPRPDEQETPEEALEGAYDQLRKGIESDLLEQVAAASPGFFERLVLDLLLQMGYGGSREEAGRVLGRSGDGGVDGIINEDRLGLDVVYIQAKRWVDSVGRPEIQKFAGALQGHRAKKGVFITTSSFSRDAIEFAERIDTRIVLLDGHRLASLMYEHGIGVSPRATYHVKQVDTDYFTEE
jgi:restriction system protein